MVPLYSKGKTFDNFRFNGVNHSVEFVESIEVVAGVICHVYSFVDDGRKDLGLIFIEPGCQTPRQRIVQGEKTSEIYLSGAGQLVIERPNGRNWRIEFSNSNRPFGLDVEVGETMQWSALGASPLIVAEICWPPYEDGRFLNLE